MAVCLNCGQENPERFRFCGACAAPLEAKAVSPQEARKTVSIVFCDLTGSTALGERLDSESLREVMDRYFTHMRDVLERHGGIVEKYIGDAVMAVFGLPRVREDDALRAVRGTWEMRQALRDLNRELEHDWNITLSNRTGVNSGEVVVGDALTRQRLITGDAVNVAARLQQAAAPGEVLIGEAIYRLVKDAVEVEPVEPLALKGKSKPMPAFRLVDIKGRMPATTPRLDTPLVGREDELEALLASFEHSVEHKRLYVTTVLGDAGVGKSRLVSGAVSRLGPRVRMLHGRCLSYGESISFWPLAETIRSGAEISDDDSLATARSKVVTMLAGQNEVEEIAERLLSLIGLGSNSFPIEETFWASRKTFETIAKSMPLIVLFEDIHWAEPTFLDFIDYLAEFCDQASILVICGARPELLEKRSEWMEGRPNASLIALKPLTPHETKSLLDNLLGSSRLSDSAASRITRSAQGNPLFVEQIVSMWVEDGVLRRHHGQWVITSSAASFAVPPTIFALLEARLDRLEQEERSVIAAASVVGETFYRGAIDVLCSPELVSSVAVNLASLTTKELIHPGGATLGDEEVFTFQHVLIRDAAYQGILKKTRAELHERFAFWLEGTVGERIKEYEAILGHHLEEAYWRISELGLENDRTRSLAAQAARWLSAAGRRAYGVGDMPAAVNLLNRSTSLLPPTTSERIELLLMVGTALVEVGELTRGGDVFADVIEEARAAGNRRLEQHALIERAGTRSWTGGERERRELKAVVDTAVRVLEEHEDDAGLARAFKWLAELHNASGQQGARAAALQRALTHAKAAGDESQRMEILSYLTAAIAQSPVSVEEGIQRCEEHLEDLGNRSVEAGILADIASLRGRQGNFEAARELLERSRAIFHELGLQWAVARQSQLEGELEMLADNPAGAEDKLKSGCAIFEAMGESGRLWTVQALLAEAVYRQGRYEEAERYARATPHGEGDDEMAMSVLAKVMARRGSIEAEALARRAVEGLKKTDVLDWQANALMDLAEVHCLTGKSEDALPVLEEAIRLYDLKGNIVSAGKARKLVGILP
jgi:predicted ATPase/class 3 adenylate cyclase